MKSKDSAMTIFSALQISIKKFIEAQKRLQGINSIIIHARTTILGLQAKMDVLTSSVARNDLKYFSSLWILTDSDNISDCDLEVNIN